MSDEEQTDAEKELAKAWFVAFEDLIGTALLSESVADRLRADEAILNYCVALGQSINAPYMPRNRPPEEEEEESEDEDD